MAYEATEVLRSLLAAKGVSQRGFAKLSGMQTSFISRILTNQKRLPRSLIVQAFTLLDLSAEERERLEAADDADSLRLRRAEG